MLLSGSADAAAAEAGEELKGEVLPKSLRSAAPAALSP